jgi:prevent-host-death family protein
MYSMIAVTATQAARNFANILDSVEHGETVVITRDGVPVGRLVPERRTSADRLKTALRDNPADAGFADDLERVHDDLRSAFTDEVHGWSGE